MTEDRTEEFANAAEGAAVVLARRFLATGESVETVLIAAFLAGVRYVQTVQAEGGK